MTTLVKVDELDLNLMQDRQAIIVASSPEQMEKATATMLAWCDKRIEVIRADIADLEANYEIAKKAKWKATPWKTRANRELRKITFYEKVKAALNAGYHLIPNFPADVFAIRTSKKEPDPNTDKRTGSWPQAQSGVQITNSPQIGDGTYVAPQATDEKWREENKKTDGKVEVERYAQAIEFDDPTFPFTMVKAEILSDTQKAMTLKIFDEIAVVPPRQRRGDPIVVGRVVYRDSAYHTKTVSFLISWFLDLRQL